jgi:hypothetical protein
VGDLLLVVLDEVALAKMIELEEAEEDETGPNDADPVGAGPEERGEAVMLPEALLEVDPDTWSELMEPVGNEMLPETIDKPPEPDTLKLPDDTDAVGAVTLTVTCEPPKLLKVTDDELTLPDRFDISHGYMDGNMPDAPEP